MSRKYRQPNNNLNDDRQFNRRRGDYHNNNNRRTHVLNRLGQRSGSNQDNRQGSSFRNRNNHRNTYNDTINNKNDNVVNENFYKVIIPHGNNYEEEYIVRLLRENLDDMDDPITFFNYTKEKGSCTFFVDGEDRADTLRSLSRRIRTTTGQRLVILTNRSSPPNSPVDEKLTQIIKEAMLSCYDVQNQMINLSRFRDCPVFKRNGIYVALHRPVVLKAVIELLIQNAPQTIAINLSDNNIQNLEALSALTNLYQLKALDLSKNKIKKIIELHHLKNLNLTELVLEGNLFVKAFPTPSSYVSAVRKLFPNLRTLDKEELPDQIGFDLGVTENLPPIKGSFIPDENLKNFITGFLQEYYRMYDSENRQQLLIAYHERAIMTLSITQQNKDYKPNDLMMKESHNLLRVNDESQWVKQVKTSSVDIVSFLNKLPITKHNLDSFQVDIPFFSSEFINVVVNGVFVETLKSNNPLKTFCRTFFLVPQNSGFVIVNEMFLVSSSTLKQNTEYKDFITLNKPGGDDTSGRIMNSGFDFPSTSSSTSDMLRVVISNDSSPSSSLLNSQQREEIIQNFKNATKMNRAFSIQCLDENQFNPAKAYEVFIKLRQANALPPEAFSE